MDSADKDATADRNVVPGAMATALSSPLSLIFSHSFSLHHPHSLPFMCLSSSLLHVFFLVFFSLLQQIHSLLHQAFSFLFLLPPTRLHPCFPLSTCYSTASFPCHHDFLAFLGKPFNMGSCTMFSKMCMPCWVTNWVLTSCSYDGTLMTK